MKKLLGSIAVLVIAGFTLRGHLPDPRQLVTALHEADGRWLAAAGLAMFASMGMFARQQRRLLTGFGITMPRHRALALAYSRSAMSISLPAGSAMSAAYAFRQFRLGGADRRSATKVMVLSAVLSAAGLVVLYTTGALAVVFLGVSTAWQAHPAMTVAAVVLLAVVIGLLIRFASHSILPRHWLLALAASVANWTMDLLCLAATAQAFALPIGLPELAAIYVTVQLVRQVPLTPGGIGVIEASLLTGFATAGVTDATAAATVLSYRVLSCWLIIPIGAVGWLVLRRRRATSDVVDAALLDELERPAEGGAGFGVNLRGVGPRRDMGDQQPAGPGPAGELPGFDPREVDPGRAVVGVGPRRLAEQHVGVGRELVQYRAHPGVAGVGQRAAGMAQPQPIRRSRMEDLEGEDLERPDRHRLGRQRRKRVHVGEVDLGALGFARRVEVDQPLLGVCGAVDR